MIVPAYNEEQILKELIEDWPSVKRHAKKISAGRNPTSTFSVINSSRFIRNGKLLYHSFFPKEENSLSLLHI